MKKTTIDYAKHPTNGYLLDFIVKSFGIEQKDENFRKLYQRFVKEENISVEEYSDILNSIISDICYTLKIKGSNENFLKQIILEFFNYLTQVKLSNETLECSQKQLDFIIMMDIIIPFVQNICSLNFPNKKISFDELLPTYKTSSVQIVFEILESDFTDKNFDIKKLLHNILDDEKIIGYDSINKDTTNWLKGISIPNSQHIELISKLSKYTKNFKTDELIFYFYIAKLIQQLYEKSIQYFGNDLADLLINHFNFIGELTKAKLDFNEDIEHNILSRYSYIYIDLPKQIFTQNLFNVLSHKNYDNTQISIISNVINERYKYQNLLYKIDEKTFFNHIDTILPIKHFKNQIKLSELKDFKPSQPIYGELLSNLYILTLPSEDKTQCKEDEFLHVASKFNDIYETKNNPYFAFVNARYYAQKREYSKATKSYVTALKYGKNVMGANIKSIIQEGLIVSAQNTKLDRVDLINAKSDFTKFYKEAYFYKLIADLPKERNQIFLNDTKKQFDIYFKNLFPNTKESDSIFITPNIIASDFNQKDIKIDYKNPDKLIKKGFPNPITQLMFCANIGDYKSVKMLIDNGADVNLLKSSDNASALLLTLPSDNISHLNKEAIKIAKLLVPLMSIESLHTKLIKKQESALSLAITHGIVEIVKLLIFHNTDLTNKITLDEQTALYLVLQCIALAKRDKIIPVDSKDTSEFLLHSKYEMEKFAKVNMFSNAIFDKEKKEDMHKLMQNMLNSKNPKLKQIIEEQEQILVEKAKTNIDNYYKIFDLILNASKKVDIANRDNFTPLIFATDINEEELVIQLLDKGANPDWYNDDGYRAYDYANRNQNKKLMELLE